LQLDTRSDQKVTSLSLAQMSELGVDQVQSDHALLVRLGVTSATLEDVKNILAGLHEPGQNQAAAVFGMKGADLVMDQVSFNQMLADPAAASSVLSDLRSLGIDRVDVAPNQDVVKSTDVSSYALTPQTLVPVEAAVLGSYLDDVASALTQDVLNHK
jgi:hypothetical protein